MTRNAYKGMNNLQAISCATAFSNAQLPYLFCQLKYKWESKQNVAAIIVINITLIW